MMPETVERISYRFTRKEMAALLKLMDVQDIPGISVTAAVPDEETVRGLVESGAVMICGERILADKAVSLIVKNIGSSEKRLTVRGDKRSVVLMLGQQMCVLADENGDLITLEPLQNADAARDSLLHAACRLHGGLHAEATCQKGIVGESDDMEGLISLYGKIIAE